MQNLWVEKEFGVFREQKENQMGFGGQDKFPWAEAKDIQGPIHSELVDMIRLSHFYVWCEAAEWF